MIELRSRPSSSGTSGYIQVNTEDDDFDPTQYSRSRNIRRDGLKQISRLQKLKGFLPQEPPKGCAKCCAVFSCSGVVFLTVLAVLIAYNAQYLRLSPERLGKKQELVGAVMGAVMMYLGFFILSVYILYRSPAQRVVEDGRFLH